MRLLRFAGLTSSSTAIRLPLSKCRVGTGSPSPAGSLSLEYQVEPPGRSSSRRRAGNSKALPSGVLPVRPAVARAALLPGWGNTPTTAIGLPSGIGIPFTPPQACHRAVARARGGAPGGRFAVRRGRVAVPQRLANKTARHEHLFLAQSDLGSAVSVLPSRGTRSSRHRRFDQLCPATRRRESPVSRFRARPYRAASNRCSLQPTHPGRPSPVTALDRHGTLRATAACARRIARRRFLEDAALKLGGRHCDACHSFCFSAAQARFRGLGLGDVESRFPPRRAVPMADRARPSTARRLESRRLGSSPASGEAAAGGGGCRYFGGASPHRATSSTLTEVDSRSRGPAVKRGQHSACTPRTATRSEPPVCDIVPVGRFSTLVWLEMQYR